MDSWPAAARKALVILATSVTAFAGGWIATLVLLLWIFAPSPGCEAPCDGPAYAALGFSLVVGPAVGALFCVGSLFALRRLWR